MKCIMGKRINFEEFVDSQYAIRDYMHFKAGNDYMHEARSFSKNQV